MMPRSQQWHQELLAALLHGVDAPGGFGCQRWPLPASKPWEGVGCEQQGGQIALFGSSHQRLELQTTRHTTYLLVMASSREPPGSSGCCRQEQCHARGAGCHRGVLPHRWHMSTHPSPACPPRQREGRHGLTATHRPWHRAKAASPVSPQTSMVLVAGTVLHSHCHHHMLILVLSAHTASCLAAPAVPSRICGTAEITGKKRAVLGRGTSSLCHRLIQHKG